RYTSFFFQAEDGIRDFHVTGVQTCALPIYTLALALAGITVLKPSPVYPPVIPLISQVGRDQICCRTVRPCSPAGMDSPTLPRNSDRKSVVEGKGVEARCPHAQLTRTQMVKR